MASEASEVIEVAEVSLLDISINFKKATAFEVTEVPFLVDWPQKL